MKSTFPYALLVAANLSAAPALGSPAGELDPAFGDHGRILLRESRFEELGGIDVFVDSGKLLAVASGYYGNALLRFDDGGSLDPGFGDQGLVPLDFGDDSVQILGVERLADGRLLIAGAMDVFGDPDNVIHGAGLLARMHADGTPDESFGSNGRATFELGGVYEALSEILVQADGRIVALGSTNRSGSVERVLAGYTRDGLPDTGFGDRGTPGIGVVDVTADENLAEIVQLGDGKFLACGSASSRTAPSPSTVLAVRIRPDGLRDPTFGNDGKVTITGWQDPVEIATCVELADGHLLFAGSSGRNEGQRAALLRLAPDGRLDAAFGINGMVTLDNGRPSAATAMLIMSDGSLAVAGINWKVVEGWLAWRDMLVARIDPTSGAIDRGFGDRGMTSVDFGTRGFPGGAFPAKLRQQPDGRLVIVGSQVDRYDWWYAYSIALMRIDPYGAGSNGWAGLADTHMSVVREADAVSLLLRRTGGSTGELSVDYGTLDDTATAGEDYVAANGTLTWPDGDWNDKTLTIDVLRSEPSNDVRSFIVELSNSSGGLAMDRAIVSILPPKPPPATPPATPPASGGSNGNDSGNSGGGAIGIELGLLMLLTLFGLRAAARRARRQGTRPQRERLPRASTCRNGPCAGFLR